jgi:hypothetical protein
MACPLAVSMAQAQEQRRFEPLARLGEPSS